MIYSIFLIFFSWLSGFLSYEVYYNYMYCGDFLMPQTIKPIEREKLEPELNDYEKLNKLKLEIRLLENKIYFEKFGNYEF